MPLRRQVDRQSRPDRLPEHDAQHRPRPRPGPRDDHSAGARPRRRAAADDARVDVQLHPPQRRRPAPARRHPKRDRHHCLDRRTRRTPDSPGLCRGFFTVTHENTNGHELNPRQSRGLSALDWSQMRSTAQIRKAISQIVPGFEQMADIDRTKQEFQIGGRTFHTAQFATPDGRARLARARVARPRRHRSR